METCMCFTFLCFMVVSLMHVLILFFYLLSGMELIETHRGGMSLVHDSYRYRKDRAYDDRLTWRCCRKGCKSRCITDRSGKHFLSPPTAHQPFHDVDEKDLQLARARTAVKQKARDDPDVKPGKVVCSEANKHHHLNYTHIPRLTQVFKRVRRTQQPPLPLNHEQLFVLLDEFDFQELDIKLLVNDSASKIVVFGSSEGLNHLFRADHVLGDGTFKFCTKYFEQLYTWHAFGNNGIYVPCVFCLLPDKKEKTYNTMIGYIQEQARLMDTQFHPNYLHVDMETAMHNAFKWRLPNSIIKICRFHLAQAWYRNIQKHGLVAEYKCHTSNVGEWLKIIFGLPSLPVEEVLSFFTDVILVTEPDDEKVHLFTQYLLSMYLDTSSTFPPHMWSGMDESVTTTNACESFHRQLQDVFSSHHPTIWNFVSALNSEIQKSKLKIKVSDPPKKSKKNRDQEDAKKHIRLQYMSGEMSQYDYVKRMSFKMLPTSI